MAIRVLCKIRVLIKFEFHNPSLSYGSLLNILYRGIGTTRYCRVGALTKLQNFSPPFTFWKSIFFVQLGKDLRCKCRIGSFTNLGSLSNLNSANPVLFSVIYLIYSTVVQEQNAIVETSKFQIPISFPEIHLFFVLCGKYLKCEWRLGSFAK